MASTNPARGMRDFLPADVRKRNYVIGIIKSVYESYGFEPLETPSVENLETLMGKYGDEGNQLVFKILKRGEKLDEAFANGGNASVNERALSDLALRYDLTVPLARVVANNKNDLPKFFKRYQIQPVWRADRPARGRFREFYQCDVDAIGSESPLIEVEIIWAASEILRRLGFTDFVIRINHRDLLTGILDAAGVERTKHQDALVAIDKIDKIGREGVTKELRTRNISSEAESKLIAFFNYFITEKSSQVFSDIEKKKLVQLQRDLKNLETDLEGSRIFWNELKEKEGEDSLVNLVASLISIVLESRLPVYNLLTSLLLHDFLKGHELGEAAFTNLWTIILILVGFDDTINVRLDPSLARGLSYYTGAIMEINVPDLAGSLGGGGRYDGLIGMFGKEQIPACGFSLGLERILVVMEERGMFPPEIADSTPADVMVTIWNEATVPDSLKLANELRGQGLRVTVYPQPDKEDKQWKYANAIKVPWLCIVNDTDIADGMVSFQNLRTKERFREPIKNVAAKIRQG